MRYLTTFILIIILVGCNHYKIQFVDIEKRAPNEILKEEIKKKDAYVVVHFINDSIEKDIRLIDIKEWNDGVISDIERYDKNNPRFTHYEESKIKLGGKTKKEGIASPMNKPYLNQLHLYVYDNDVQMEGGKMVIRNDQVSVIRELRYETGPPTFIMFIVFGGIILAGFLIMVIAFLINSAKKGVTNILSGCYVATMVYESYDADEVVILRRYRDQVLKRYVFGRWFIKAYYRLSPRFVRRHQNRTRLKRAIKSILNIFVGYLVKKYDWELGYKPIGLN